MHNFSRYQREKTRPYFQRIAIVCLFLSGDSLKDPFKRLAFFNHLTQNSPRLKRLPRDHLSKTFNGKCMSCFHLEPEKIKTNNGLATKHGGNYGEFGDSLLIITLNVNGLNSSIKAEICRNNLKLNHFLNPFCRSLTSN